MTANRWNVAVFARNEAASIGGCLHALARARGDADLQVTVVLNGADDGSAAIAGAALRQSGLRGRVFSIPLADKANAVNQYLHRLREPAETYFCVDGYVTVAPDALRLLAERLRATPAANAAAAVPSTGRSAARLRQAMIEAPGLHGSLFALRGSFVERLAALGLRIPLHFYRGDGLLGSFALHDLDVVQGGWHGFRIAVEPQATWTTQELQPWRLRDARRLWNRLVQQGRGRLQWAALRAAIYPAGFAALPDDADRQTLDWIAAAPAQRTPRPWRDPFAALALRRMRHMRQDFDAEPRLVADV